MAVQQLFVTEVTQQMSGNEDFITIQHGTDNAVSKSKIKASVIPNDFFEMIGDMNENFKTVCKLGEDVNYAITGFKIRDAKSGNQEIQFIVNIRTDYIYFENAKTDWLEIREIDLSSLSGNINYRKKALAINSLIIQFNNLQSYIRDNIAAWLEMEDEEKQLSLFDIRKDFQESMQSISDKNGSTMTISTGGRELAKFKPKNDPEILLAQLENL